MRKALFFTVILFMTFIISNSLYAQDKKATVANNKPVNKVCLVSNEKLDKAVTTEYKGKTYAFCCKKCLAKFQKNPEKYLKNIGPDGNLKKSVKE
jgi:YHS domain-containing protein